MPKRPQMTPEIFWQRVDKNGPIPKDHPELGPCWLWMGGKTGRGYGAAYVYGKYHGAHRFAYEFYHGPIPEGLQVCHQCDNPQCLNATGHLFLGTGFDNMSNKVSKNRQAQGLKHSLAVMKNRPRGERHRMSKVTDSEVLEMRRLCRETKLPMSAIAERFALSLSAAEKAIRGVTWKHLGPVNHPKNRLLKLSEEIVREIRRLSQEGVMVMRLAATFDVSTATIGNIIHNRTWKDLK